MNPGGLLTYTGSVSNAGNVTLNNIIVTNSQSGITPILTVLTLAPGASTNFTGSYLAPANCSSTSASTAIGQSLCDIGVTNAASTTCPITFTPNIALTETCPPGPVSVGSTVVFGGSVNNSGNVTLTNVLVFSSQPSNNTPLLGPITLAPGASAPFTGSYIALGGSNPTTNTTIVTNSSGTITTNIVDVITTNVVGVITTNVVAVITTNTSGSITTNDVSTVTTNAVTPTFGYIDPNIGILNDLFSVPPDLHGLMYADQDEYYGPTLFYAIREPAASAAEFDTISTVPPAFGAVTDEFTLTESNYDALTFAADNVGYGAVNFYYVRHDNTGACTFGQIISQGDGQYSKDLWTLDNPAAKTGYTGLAYAAANVGNYGATLFYSVRQENAGLSTFGIINPTPGGSETDEYAVGTNFDSLVYVDGTISAWSATDVFAYLRHNAIGSIIGSIDPVTHVATDRINLGTNFLNALTFTVTAVGNQGPNLFYYLRPAGSILTTNTVTNLTTNTVTTYTTNDVTSYTTNASTNFTTNVVLTLITNTVNTYMTNILVVFTPTNTVTAIGMDICQEQTVTAAANCLGPVSSALIAPTFGVAAVIANGSFGLSFHSLNGILYTVQYNNTLDPATWTDLETVVGTGGSMTIKDGIVSQRPMRFYRVKFTP